MDVQLAESRRKIALLQRAQGLVFEEENMALSQRAFQTLDDGIGQRPGKIDAGHQPADGGTERSDEEFDVLSVHESTLDRSSRGQFGRRQASVQLRVKPERLGVTPTARQISSSVQPS